MILYDDALRLLQNTGASVTLSTENIPIENAVGRVLAKDIINQEFLPPFDNSSMDGFALRSKETESAGRFDVVGCLAAGEPPIEPEPSEGSAWEIMTGAPIPKGFDCVVKIEDVIVERNSHGKASAIYIKKPLAFHENFRGRGEDFSPGATIAHKGTVISSETLLSLAAIGAAEIPVFRRPRIALLSTGGEICAHTQTTLRPGQIRNSTRPFLMASFPLYGLECIHVDSVGDDPKDFRRALETILQKEPDILLTTGAVSKGHYDYVPDEVSTLGAEILFHKTAIRPGKPGLFARLEKTAIFGVPGNPVSTAVALRFFVARYLEALLGIEPERPSQAQLKKTARKPEGLRCFFKAHLELSGGRAEVTSLAGQESFRVGPLLQSNAWVIFPEENDQIREGTLVDVFPLQPEWRRGIL